MFTNNLIMQYVLLIDYSADSVLYILLLKKVCSQASVIKCFTLTVEVWLYGNSPSPGKNVTWAVYNIQGEPRTCFTNMPFWPASTGISHM